jgi:acrylyl-CoA reductase (NADPH)
MAPKERRLRAWNRLALDLDPALLESMTREIPLSQAIAAATELLAGQVQGRLVVNVNA